MRQFLSAVATGWVLLGFTPTSASTCSRIVPSPPSVTGFIGNLPVTAVLDYTGTNGEATGAAVFWTVFSGNGDLSQGAKIAAVEGGDRMKIFFRDGYMYATNAIYLPGEAHCCYTHLAVQRFRTDLISAGKATVVLDGVATVAVLPVPDAVNASFHSCPVGTMDRNAFKAWSDAQEERDVAAPFDRR